MGEFNEERWKREELQRNDAARFDIRAARAARTKIHRIIPHQFFSGASSKCRNLFIDGHFYGCISLAQAVTEALSRFLGKRHKIGARKDAVKRVVRLFASGQISETVAEAFGRIWGNDCNTFHHINEDIVSNHQALEQRAEECVNNLYIIESEVFAFRVVNGAIVPARPEYWPQSGPNQVLVYLRSGH